MSSGSSCPASAVEPTRSQNSTVNCRRSASRGGALEAPASPRPAVSLSGSRSAAIAFSNFLRWPSREASELDWTRRFQPIADALAALPANDLILDGEAVVADSRGIPDFGLLHADLAAGRKDRLLYYAFDLLYLDGFDLRGARLAERKRLLAELLAGASERILYAEHLEGDGAEIYRARLRHGP